MGVAHVDLSDRFAVTTTIVASPALAAETIIASITLPQNVVLSSGIQVFGWGALTIGTSGTALNLRIRQTSVTGSVIVATGAQGVTAAALTETGLQGFDASPTLPGQIYVLTAQVTAGAAASTFSAVQLYVNLI